MSLMTTEQTLVEQYRRIVEISQQLSSTYDLPMLLRKICALAKELIDVEASSILLLDESRKQLRFAMSTNIRPSEMEEIFVPIEGSIAGWIVSHGEPRVIENVTATPNHYAAVDSRLQFHTRNLLGVPMRTYEKVIGVVQAINKNGNMSFTDQDIQMLRTLASQAAIAIENARLFQQSDFINELVHELRNPLMALKASTTLLARPDLPEDKRSYIIDKLKQETQRLIDLTSEFLDVARMESGRISLSLTRFSIRELITESAEVLAQQAAAKQVTIRIQPEDYLVEADRGKIKQVVLNLLSNAIKYNRTEGKVDIFLSLLHNSDQSYVHVTIADTGYGIPPEHQKNMFQKFYRVPTLEHVERGTGLGLALCKHIIEAHGGTIWFESEVGVGSRFQFTVPFGG
jgi:signal transduction histidine kinase